MKQKTGFTIVELLIVIVVIAILAAISVVAYNGIQDRGRYSSTKQNLASINKAVQLFYADKGYYPYSGSSSSNVIADSSTSLAIPGLAPAYIQTVPPIPNDGKGGYYAYIWSANGTEYKLIRLSTTSATLPAIESSDPQPDPSRPGRGWGWWSSGGSGL